VKTAQYFAATIIEYKHFFLLTPKLLFKQFLFKIIINQVTLYSYSVFVMAGKTSLWLITVLTVVVIAGMVLEPSGSTPSDTKYIITNVGISLIVFLGAYIGIDMARKFTMNGAVGKSLMFISLGMISWGIGQMIWFYYNIVLRTDVPYPSFSDVGYLGLIPLAAYGLYCLWKSLVIKFDLKAKIKTLIIPLIVFAMTYFLFMYSKVAENTDLLTKSLNIAYPLGDAIFLSFTVLILASVKGSKLFRPIAIICIGFIVEAIADFMFSWSTSAEIYYVGSVFDVPFALAFCIIGIGMYYMKDVVN
jgi:hypothetical protein